MKNTMVANIPRLFLAVVVLIASTTLWVQGFLKSPIVHPELIEQQKSTKRYRQEHTPNLQAERTLAEAYWTRYRDVKEDSHFGVSGPSGIFGAREHYDLYGKSEGRFFGPIHTPDDLVLEQQLAESYWQRYPKIEQSSAWGRKSQLGILGPRDHYNYHGKHNGMKWGDLSEIKE